MTMTGEVKTKPKKRKTEIMRKWYLVDAEGKILGRLATEIADLLRGKERVDFAYHLDQGNFVIVTNTDKIRVTGRKKERKIYFRPTGYPGHLREEKLGELLRENSCEVLRRAVLRMLPKNKLRAKMMRRLKIFKGAEHSYKDKKLVKYES